MNTKYDLAVQLLKELNCPAEIMDALYIWGMMVREELHNWQALSQGGVVEGEAIEIKPEELLSGGKEKR